MDTNSNIPAQKKIVSVEILHLDEMGYGPRGDLTRRQWRNSCLSYLEDEQDIFNDWCRSWENKTFTNIPMISFGYKLTFADGSHAVINEGKESFSCSESLDFIGLEFTKPLFLERYEFIAPVMFSHSKFKEWVRFTNSKFSHEVNFSSAHFLSHANFAHVEVDKNIIFGHVIFNGYADFSNLRVNNYTYFKNANFKMGASFSKCEFKNNVNFSCANFKEFANFSETKFYQTANFRSTIFNSWTSYRNAYFFQQCRFDSLTENNLRVTTFTKESTFENAVFKNVGHFEKVLFKGEVPSFLGVENAVTRLEFSGDEYFSKTYVTEDAVKRLGLLKRLSDEHGQTDQALMFNAFELNAKSKQPDASIAVKIITSLYEIVSDYGRSFIRPSIFYVILICLSFMYSYTYTPNISSDLSVSNREFCKPPEKEPQLLNLSKARAAFEYAMFRAGGLMDFTDTGKQNNAVNCRLFEEPIEPPLMRAWGILKGIASIALLFLVALGLRNKYRIK
jgi:hypothetical protein